MPTTKHNAVVLSVAVVVAVAILLFYGKRHSSSPPSSKYSYQVFQLTNGWGYDISMDGKRIIHQENIPVVSEIKGFDKKDEAVHAASMVIQKLEQNKLPTLTKEEIGQICPESMPK